MVRPHHIFLVWLAAIFLYGASWLTNAYQFTQCDFNKLGKCEIIHGVGFIPPFSVVAVWINTKSTTDTTTAPQ